MALLPEWNLFSTGIIFGSIGLVLGIITLLVWCKLENKRLPKISVKGFFKTAYAVLGVLVFGVRMVLVLAIGFIF